jgi:hypothetical protein
MGKWELSSTNSIQDWYKLYTSCYGRPTQYAFERRLDGPRGQSGRSGEEKTSQTLSRTSSPQTTSHTDFAAEAHTFQRGVKNDFQVFNFMFTFINSKYLEVISERLSAISTYLSKMKFAKNNVRNRPDVDKVESCLRMMLLIYAPPVTSLPWHPQGLQL